MALPFGLQLTENFRVSKGGGNLMNIHVSVFLMSVAMLNEVQKVFSPSGCFIVSKKHIEILCGQT